MRRLYILIAVTVVGVLLVPGVAGSAAKKKRAVDVTAKAAIVEQAGGVNTVAGSLTGKPAGPGAVVYKARAAGSQVTSTYTAFAKGGTFRGTTVVTATPQPDGTTSFDGTLQIAGGSGKYRGAKGKDLNVTGTLANNVFTFRITGSVRY